MLHEEGFDDPYQFQPVISADGEDPALWYAVLFFLGAATGFAGGMMIAG